MVFHEAHVVQHLPRSRANRPAAQRISKLGNVRVVAHVSRSIGDSCDHEAVYYVLTDEVLSAYACEEHLEGTLQRAQA